MSKEKITLFLVIAVSFHPNSLLAEETEQSGFCGFLTTTITNCINIWTQLDLLRSIHYSRDQHVASLQKITESLLLLYQPLVTGLTENKENSLKEGIESLHDMCSSISGNLQELYEKAALKEAINDTHICSQVVLKRIMDHLALSCEKLS